MLEARSHGGAADNPSASGEFPGDLSLVSIATPATAAIAGDRAAALSCLGGDLLGESLLDYSWTATSAPAGALVTFSPNDSNPAKNTLATFSQRGHYRLTCTVSNGLSTIASSVALMVT